MKVLSIIGILASLFLIYVSYGVQNLSAYPNQFGTGCSCTIGADIDIIPIILYILSGFFLILSGLSLKASLKK